MSHNSHKRAWQQGDQLEKLKKTVALVIETIENGMKCDEKQDINSTNVNILFIPISFLKCAF